jgi:hypothetical protein
MDIDDELFIATKAAAIQRRTTMKAIVEHALRREIAPSKDLAVEETQSFFTTGRHGLPVLTKKSATKVSSETIYSMMEDEGI